MKIHAREFMHAYIYITYKRTYSLSYLCFVCQMKTLFSQVPLYDMLLSCSFGLKYAEFVPTELVSVYVCMYVCMYVESVPTRLVCVYVCMYACMYVC